jgi:nucleoside-diphosphate-sugar epimerase
MKWAVLGASGFVGSRFVEKMHLTGKASVRPIVRNFQSLARLSRFELDWRVTELTDVPRLTKALEGCDVLLHSIVGDESVILGTIAPVYEAARLAGIHRIVYLSSSSVHGLAPDPSTTEDTPLSDQQTFSYNNAKVKAEKLWAKVRSGGKVEFVGLRPSIVFGPRSRWCADIARQAQNGTAYLLLNGTGICNTIYVDNLIDAIVSSAEAPGVDGNYFFVRDRETVTWKDFYQPIVQACGVDLREIHQVDVPEFRQSKQDQIARLRGNALLKLIKPLAPRVSIRVVKAALGALPTPETPSPWPSANGKPHADVTEEMAALQQCTWQMPCAKAEKLLGYKPQTNFGEGMQRSSDG